MSNYLSQFISISAEMLPPVVASAGLGVPLFLVEEDAQPLFGGYQRIPDGANAEALANANVISGANAAIIGKMFMQSPAPAYVLIATHDGTPNDVGNVLTAMENSGEDFGIICIDDTALNMNVAVASWLAQGARRWTYAASLTTETIPSSAVKPPNTVSMQLPTLALHLQSDPDATQACVAAAKWSAIRLFQGPLANKITLFDVPVDSNLTVSDQAYAFAIDMNVLKPFGNGSYSSTFILDQVNSYAGSSFTAGISTLYTVKRCLGSVQPMILKLANQGRPLKTGLSGEALVRGAIEPVLKQLSEAGHYDSFILNPNTEDELALPDGYLVDVYSLGSEIYADITLAINQEATKLNIHFSTQVV